MSRSTSFPPSLSSGRLQALGSLWGVAYFLKVLLGVVWQLLPQRGSALVQRRLVGVVLAGSRNIAEDLGVLEGSTQLHFLRGEYGTSLPLPKLKPFVSSFLNSVPNS
jgi:hypothetical protein